MKKSAATRTAAVLPANRVTRRQCGCGNHSASGSECSTCAGKKLQRKLRIGTTNDPMELEADRIADQVMAYRPAHSLSNISTPKIQRRAEHSSEKAGEVPRTVEQVLARSGSPLPTAVRKDMEQRFGQDFSQVRMHTGSAAEQSASDVNANAYTLGNNIVFNRGKFSPETRTGKHLLAHELTHVIQQRANSHEALQRDIDQVELERCMASLGDTNQQGKGYIVDRPAGAASEKEVEQYRKECTERQKSKQSSGPDAIKNLARAWEYAKKNLAPQVKKELEGLFSTESLALMAIFAGLFLAAQLTPAGWIADALALTVLTFTALFVGALVIDIAKDLAKFFSAINATTETQLEESGNALAHALARGGIAIVLALLTRGMRGASRPPPATGTALVEVVTTNGMRVPVPTNTLGAAVKASELQKLASYAVMVPPPGGKEQSSPQVSSSTGGSGNKGQKVKERGEGIQEIFEEAQGKGSASATDRGMRIDPKLSGGAVPKQFQRGNFAHRFIEYILGAKKVPRPNEAEVVVEYRDGTGDFIRVDRIIRNSETGLLLEIKPAGKSAQIGRSQMQARLSALQKEFPKQKGWSGQVVEYTRADVENWFKSEGLSPADIAELLKFLGF